MKFFGSLLFEYQATDPNEHQNTAKKSHILICLNNNQAQTLQLADKAYDWLLNLLCSYHKILYIYQQACDRYPEGRRIYSDLEKKIKEFSQIVSDPQKQLLKLDRLLAEIPQNSLEYTACLQDLESHYTAISTNISNYKTCLDKISEIGGDRPKVWDDFLNRAESKLSHQIQTYLNYLTPGKNLFEQMVATIRGIVEVEKANQDRSLERTFQVLGTAFGGGAIVSGVVTQYIEKPFAPTINFNYPVHPLVSSLVWSVLATIIFGMVAWLVTKPKQK